MAVAAGLAELADGVAEVMERKLEVRGDGKLSRIRPWSMREHQAIIEPTLSAEAKYEFAAVVAGKEVGDRTVIAAGGVILPGIADHIHGIIVVTDARGFEKPVQLRRNLVIPSLAEFRWWVLSLHRLLDLVPLIVGVDDPRPEGIECGATIWIRKPDNQDQNP